MIGCSCEADDTSRSPTGMETVVVVVVVVRVSEDAPPDWIRWDTVLTSSGCSSVRSVFTAVRLSYSSEKKTRCPSDISVFIDHNKDVVHSPSVTDCGLACFMTVITY